MVTKSAGLYSLGYTKTSSKLYLRSDSHRISDTQLEMAEEPEDYDFLKWFFRELDVGPSDDDLKQYMMEKYEKGLARSVRI